MMSSLHILKLLVSPGVELTRKPGSVGELEFFTVANDVEESVGEMNVSRMPHFFRSGQCFMRSFLFICIFDGYDI